MKRQLTQIKLAGTAFTIDTHKRELREVGYCGNRISFDDMKDGGDFYTLLFDIQTQNIARGMREANNDDDRLRQITIPQQILLDNTVDGEYISAVNENSEKKNWGIALVGDTEQLESKGNKPVRKKQKRSR